jgi:hypothetical protein
MNVEIGAEAALFPEKEYISGIYVAVYSEFCIYSRATFYPPRLLVPIQSTCIFSVYKYTHLCVPIQPTCIHPAYLYLPGLLVNNQPTCTYPAYLYLTGLHVLPGLLVPTPPTCIYPA